MKHGNLINNQLALFDDLNNDELHDFAIHVLMQIRDSDEKMANDKILSYILILSAKIGTYYDGKLNAKERRFIFTLFNHFFENPDQIIESLKSPIDKNEEKLISLLSQNASIVSLGFLHLIIIFAYSDGVIEDDLIQYLENKFSLVLMKGFFDSGKESVRVSGPLLKGLEADIVTWLAKDDQLVKMKDLYGKFNKYSRKDVEQAVNNLKDKNVIFKSDTFVGEMVGLTGEPYRISRDAKSNSTVNDNKKQKTSKSKKTDQLTQLVTVANSFQIFLPENMEYVSSDIPQGAAKRVLTAFTEDGNINDQSDVQHPWSLRRNITFTFPDKQKINFSSKKELDSNIKKWTDFAKSVHGINELNTVKKDRLIILYFLNGKNIIQMFIITENGCFAGQYFMNDVKQTSKAKKLGEEFIGKMQAVETVVKKSTNTVPDRAGIMPEKASDTNTTLQKKDLTQKVVIDNEIIVYLPSDMDYSTDLIQIGQHRLLSAITKDSHDVSDFRDNPFDARRNITITQMRGPAFEGMTLNEIDELVSEFISSLCYEEVITVKDNKSLIVKYSMCDNYAYIFTITKSGMFQIQYFINDIKDEEEMEKLVKAFSEKITYCTSKDKTQIVAEKFSEPSFKEKRRSIIDNLLIPTPDNMETTEEYTKNTGDDMELVVQIKDLKYLAITRNYSRGFANFSDAPFYFLINSKIAQDDAFNKMWNPPKKMSVDVGENLLGWLRNYLEKADKKQYQPSLIKCNNNQKYAIGFTQDGEAADKSWRTYAFLILHNDKLYQGKIGFNCTGKLTDMKQFVEKWLNMIKPVSDKDLEILKIKEQKEALGDQFEADGKLNAFHIVDLFYENVIFTEKSDYSKEEDHDLTGLNMNEEKVDEYPKVDQCWDLYSSQIFDLAEYLNENDNLKIPKELIHRNLQKMVFGYNLSGSLIFNLLYERLIKITENENHYHVEIDHNLVYGIPEAYLYIIEFIKILRNYNRHGNSFDVTFEIVTGRSSLKKDISKPVYGSAWDKTVTSVHVNGNEPPFSRIIDDLQDQIMIEEERKKKENDYNEALSLTKTNNLSLLKKAREIFKSDPSYKDSRQYITNLNKKIKELEIIEKYNTARELFYLKGLENLEKSAALFEEIKDYKDSEEMLEKVLGEKENLEKELEQQRLNDIYNSACMLTYENDIEDFNQAIELFEELGDYKDSKELLQNAIKDRNSLIQKQEDEKKEEIYLEACSLAGEKNIGKMEQAVKMLEEIQDYKDSKQVIENINAQHDAIIKEEEDRRQSAYNEGVRLMEKEDATVDDYRDAIESFQKSNGLQDANERIQKCRDDSALLVRLNKLVPDCDSNEISDLQLTIQKLKDLDGFRNANKLIEDCERKIQQIKDEYERKKNEELKQKQIKKWIIIAVIILIIVIVFMMLNK